MHDIIYRLLYLMFGFAHAFVFIGVYIEEVLNKWKGDYEKLEHNHTYIQWLVIVFFSLLL